MNKSSKIARRRFLAVAGALGALGALAPAGKGAAAPKNRDRVRVAVIGCGSVSGMYLPHLSKSPWVELVSTCDIIPERARTTAEKYGITQHYPHIDRLLDGAPFDLMVNLTDMQEHGRLNRQALAAGRNVWSEKPMANTYAEGRELLALAESKGLRIWGAPAVVNSPQYIFMDRALREGRIGRVAAAHAHYGHLGPDWSAFFYEKGGGSLPDLGVYNLATLTGLLGPARSVMAMTNILTPVRRTHDKGEVRVEAEDNAMVLMEHAGGALSHVQCGFNYFDPYGHGGVGQQRPTVSVTGTGGSMHLIGYDWAPAGVDLATLDDEKGQRYVEDPGDYVWEMGASTVAECLVRGTEPRINARHALHVLEVIEAARRSQAGGMRIALESEFPWPVDG
jgi:predicted dehydrogenase